MTSILLGSNRIEKYKEEYLMPKSPTAYLILRRSAWFALLAVVLVAPMAFAQVVDTQNRTPRVAFGDNDFEPPNEQTGIVVARQRPHTAKGLPGRCGRQAFPRGPRGGRRTGAQASVFALTGYAGHVGGQGCRSSCFGDECSRCHAIMSEHDVQTPITV